MATSKQQRSVKKQKDDQITSAVCSFDVVAIAASGGLRSSEILGTSILGLDISLPVEKLKHPIRSVLEEKSNIQEVLLEAVNRRGKTIQCHVTCTPFNGASNERQGVVLMMEEQPEEK